MGLLATFIASVSVIVLGKLAPTSRWIDVTARCWARAWLTASGTKLVVTGREHVDPSRSYVVVANHLSILDIMACFVAVPFPIRFLAKKELFAIPLFASAMRAIGIVEVDRFARTAFHDQINHQTRDLVAKGRSVIIYPEGTRARSGALGPFKKGAFTMAVAGGLPVLPVTIEGSYEAWPPSTLWIRGGDVIVHIDPPVDTSALTQADAGRLRDEVHRMINRRLTASAV